MRFAPRFREEFGDDICNRFGLTISGVEDTWQKGASHIEFETDRGLFLRFFLTPSEFDHPLVSFGRKWKWSDGGEALSNHYFHFLKLLGGLDLVTGLPADSCIPYEKILPLIENTSHVVFEASVHQIIAAEGLGNGAAVRNARFPEKFVSVTPTYRSLLRERCPPK